MSKLLYCCLVLCVGVANAFHGWIYRLRVRNVLRPPTFEKTVTLRCTRAKTLFYMMQEAAEINSVFRFTVKYFGSTLGFFVEGINDVFGNYSLNKSFWEILNGKLKRTKVGVSSYVPKDGETVTFNLTQGSH